MSNQGLKRVLLWSFAAVLLTFMTKGVVAQSVFTLPDRDNVITFEITKPEFAGDDNASLITTASFLGVRVAAGPNVNLIADLPFAIFARDGFDTETAVGNPFVGLEIFPATEGVSFTLGGRLPLAPSGNSAVAVGLFHDVDRAGAWLPEVVPVRATINFQYRNENSGFLARLSGGPEAWIATEDNVDSEVVALYNAQIGYARGGVTVTGGLGGLLAITEDEGSFGERTLHQLTGALSLSQGNVRPGIHVRLPLDDGLTSVLDYSIGFNLAIFLP